ncbi:MAG: ATP-binding protein, partial [Chitinophagaceae bacterium]
GVDKDWIQNNEIQTVRYSLPPGKYIFKIYASRFFNKDATAMKEIHIVIRPPFWKTWWFLSLAILLFIGLLAYFINQNNKRKYAKKLQQLENERQLKLERERISRDLHDSLGAYANAVLYNTELHEKEKTDEKRKDRIGDLNFASKDIITSLRETVWALKKESYTAEDCIVRIRNFIQPFVKYYTHIHFRVEGEAPVNLELHYTKALNLVRIMQEAVSNSIKHANPSHITIASYPTAQKWKLTVKDDGKGFDYSSLNEYERGNGLNNIKHRAAESEFEINIDSRENSGTTITIIV